MFAPQPYNPSEISAKTVIWLEQRVLNVGRNVKKAFYYPVLRLVSAPVILFAGILFKYERWRINRIIKKLSLNHIDNSGEYLDLKEQIASLERLMPKIKRFSSLKVKSAPWEIHFLATSMRKTSLALLKYYRSLNSEIELLNKARFESNSNAFEFVSEKELWDNRNKAYDYWI